VSAAPRLADATVSRSGPLALDIRNLRKAYLSREGKVVRALLGISLGIAEGERVAILGPSGCGKSTILRILAGLDAEYSGDIQWAGAGQDNPSRLRSATVFQGDSTLPWMNVQANILVGLSGLSLDRAEAARREDYYRRLVGLSDFATALPHELSGGMRQRVAIARALATEPLLLLMDEPLAALDAQTRIVMQKELHRIWAQANCTVVYVTHDIDEALSLADRLVIMTARPGRIKAVIDVPFGREQEPLERRRCAEFGDLQVKIWRMVAEEVGQSLQGEDER
jgi:ABC-type nitrate/sulfonate/bicarbonate transport system ATPase subunit